MLFNSFEFFAFLSIFLVCFFLLPRRTQPVVVLVASYIFYIGWRPAFALLLAFTTIVDYTTALVMGATDRAALRRAAMITALTINLGILATVKYLDFAISNVVGAAGFFGYDLPQYALSLVLPVGISFYTFQSVGYTLDVYHRRVPTESNLLTYAQYVAFFPQLVAGPIERAAHMLPQFRRAHLPRQENLSGLWLIAYGLFKKMCVADTLAPVVAGIYAHPGNFSGSYTLLATIMFAIQIYCDFSGYSDIARGVARLMDFELMVNFRQPYFATSLTEFWRRWHISLSSWFRDYLYVPLGGSREGERRAIRNIIIVFVLSGVWHGAAWAFVIWGALHGLGLAAERLWRNIVGDADGKNARCRSILGWMWTSVIVLTGWVFFRAGSLDNAIAVFATLRHFGPLDYGTFKTLGLASFEILLLILNLFILVAVDYYINFRPEQLHRLSERIYLPVVGGVALMYYIVLFGVFGRLDFIYFQF
ncbi:Peptidoglycan O-acetyltransferase [Caballeronia arvi]|uniref:Probable alginate O-acetylase AlgI n=1 Tax=Caballeronia arvi TaxID=1777135 RepID=A0A158L191_9BURK|nr:MBOAT family O-acyltransferase [Caballeronia arvi]SAL86421.1 Peptidoglycan O-acetyltransferase [Caballeronia arvi]